MVEIIFDKNEDWESRVLCSDGSCIGTIGPDGRCKECGKPYEGDLKFTSAVEYAPDITGKEFSSPTQNPASGKIINDTDDVFSDEDWENRVLCSDGSCIGTIGPDGRCKECGKPLKQ